MLALAGYDDGTGPALYAAGTFQEIGGVAANYVARWDGTSWSPLGAGLDRRAYALAVYDGGSGPELVVGGAFDFAGGAAAEQIAKWDGTSWSPLGNTLNAFVHALVVFDDGTGPGLYAAGNFALGAARSRVARWDGSSWTPLGLGTNGSSYYALAAFDDGTGPALFAGGAFHTIGSVSAERIAKWTGAEWQPLGDGTDGVVRALAAFDDGSGPALYATGSFTNAGGVHAHGIARWDGTTWTAPLGDGLSHPFAHGAVGTGNALAAFDDPSELGPALYVGGDLLAYDSGDAHLARWQGCVDTSPPVLSCPDAVRVRDGLTGPPGRVVTFAVEAIDAVDPSPSVVCVPPSGSFFPLGTTLVTATATDDAGHESTCEFPVVVEPPVRRR